MERSVDGCMCETLQLYGTAFCPCASHWILQTHSATTLAPYPTKMWGRYEQLGFKHYSEHSVELARQRNEGKYLGKRVTLCEWESNAFTGFIALNCSMRKDKGKEKEG